MAIAAAAPFLLAASTAIGVAGTAVSTFSQIQQMKYQQAVLKRNAAIDEQNAQQTRIIAAINSQEADLEGAQQSGSVAAAQSGSGLSVDSPSLAGGRVATKELIRRRVDNIRFEGQQRAQNFENSAANSRAEARSIKSQIPLAALGGVLSAGSTFISGAHSFSGSSLGGRSPRFRGGR